MAIASLLQTTFSLREPPKFTPSSLKFHHLSSASSSPRFPFKINHQQIRFSCQNTSLHPNLCALAPLHAASQSTEDCPSNPLDKLPNAILKTINSLKKPAIVAILLGVLVLGDPFFNGALAASGGMIRGSCFSDYSSDSSSSYSSSTSYSDCSSTSSSDSSDTSWSDSESTPCYSSLTLSPVVPADYESMPSYSSLTLSPVVPTRPAVSSGFKPMSNILLGISDEAYLS